MKHEHLWVLIPRKCKCGKTVPKRRHCWMEMDFTLPYTALSVKIDRKPKKAK